MLQTYNITNKKGETRTIACNNITVSPSGAICFANIVAAPGGQQGLDVLLVIGRDSYDTVEKGQLVAAPEGKA